METAFRGSVTAAVDHLDSSGVPSKLYNMTTTRLIHPFKAPTERIHTRAPGRDDLGANWSFAGLRFGINYIKITG